MHRRNILFNGVLLGWGLASQSTFAQSSDVKVIPWGNQPSAGPPQAENVIRGGAHRKKLDTQIMPDDEPSSIAHDYRQSGPKIWLLDDVSGEVRKPISLTLEQLKSLPRHR